MESELSSALMQALQSRGWYHRKMHGSEYQDGIPDYLLLTPRRVVVMAEAKVLPTRRPHMGNVMKALRPSQRKFLCDARGQHCGVVGFTPNCARPMVWIPAESLPPLLTDLDSLSSTTLDPWSMTYLDFAQKLEAL